MVVPRRVEARRLTVDERLDERDINGLRVRLRER